MARLFVAARPPQAVLDQLAALPRPAEPGVRWVPPEQWHVTLRFLGEADPDQAAAALAGLRSPEATAELGPVVSRLGRSVVCVPVAGLDELAAAVTAATAGMGGPPEARRFRGHLTLARLRHRAACGVTGTRISARFVVTQVELVRSVTGPSGAVHHVERRVPLA